MTTPWHPRHLIVKDDMLSPYSTALKQELNIKGAPTQKLVPNLYHKQRYVIHYRNLKQYIELGMELVKIYKGVEFKQSKWLEPYIAKNTELRKAAKNNFEKDLYKLMNNSVHLVRRWTNLRKRVNVELVHRSKRMKKLISKLSNYNRCRHF